MATCVRGQGDDKGWVFEASRAELNTIFETFVNHIQQSLSRQALYMETTGEASTSCTCKD